MSQFRPHVFLKYENYKILPLDMAEEALKKAKRSEAASRSRKLRRLAENLPKDETGEDENFLAYYERTMSSENPFRPLKRSHDETSRLK